MTSTELGYLSGVTSNIQTQLDGKARHFYGSCTTDATTATKTVELIAGPGFSNLQIGDIISIIFTNGNTSGAGIKLTLGTTTYNVLHSGKDLTLSMVTYPYSYYTWYPYQVVEFIVYTSAKVLMIDNNSHKYLRKLLLWENASPSSDFGAQTISLTPVSSAFSGIEIVFYTRFGDALCSTGYLPLFNGLVSQSYLLSASYLYTYIYHATRNFTIDYSTYSYPVLKFYYALKEINSATTSSQTNDNSVAIPYRIYGIMNADDTSVM